MTHCKIISMLSECFPLELSLKLRFVKGILLKGSNLIKHIAALAQHNPFSELADKYGANCYLCTNRILND